MSRDTIGKIATSLAQKIPDSRDPIEIEQELHTDYEANVLACLDAGKKEYNDDFFVVVITKKEPLLPNILRNMFFHRHSCPTPDYDQTVYRYDRTAGILEFLWVVPSKDTCLLFKEHALEIVPEERELLQHILDFSDGTFYKIAKKFNKEQEAPGGALKE